VSPIIQEFNTVIIQPQTPVKTGYTFQGWFTDNLFTSEYFFPTMPAETRTLYAKWNLNITTIEFNSNGGTGISSITQNYGTAVTAPADPTKTGYTFAGWYSDAGLSSSYTFATMPAGDLSLYAKWTTNLYTITFDSAGGSVLSALTQPFDSTLVMPENPTREGFNFGGWYIDLAKTTRFIAERMPGENLILYAKWLTNVYLIEYIGFDGTVLLSFERALELTYPM
jgi:uncharacterized repeat protein (TIGR02543 family)